MVISIFGGSGGISISPFAGVSTAALPESGEAVPSVIDFAKTRPPSKAGVDLSKKRNEAIKRVVSEIVFNEIGCKISYFINDIRNGFSSSFGRPN